ncbi:MAG: DNA primase, partial [Candidatus Cloacimonetes bacterium]|nr:DNA primase [Candidatus Cloacimonadota bacterium]
TGFYTRTEEQGRFRDIAYLGLEFNLRKFLPVGLEISRIYPGSRLYSYYGIRNGDILLSINKTKLTLDVSIDSLLSEQVNRKIDLVFICNSKEITCSIKGMAWRENRRLWFQDKQERLRQMTDDLSGSQIGYVLIPQMNTEEYNNFIRNLYTMNADKKALIIDIRGNTGGSIHNDLLSFLSRRPNAYTSRRSNGAVKRETPSRTWTKPIVLLIDENSYSDAEIFPQLFQEANLGTVIGMPTSGAVIGTWEVKLLDGSRMRMPGSGWFRLDGTNMEGNGAQPDIQIELTPEDIISENDKQLQKAVEVLLLQIK